VRIDVFVPIVTLPGLPLRATCVHEHLSPVLGVETTAPGDDQLSWQAASSSKAQCGEALLTRRQLDVARPTRKPAFPRWLRSRTGASLSGINLLRAVIAACDDERHPECNTYNKYKESPHHFLQAIYGRGAGNVASDVVQV
jgi:hypothetical protein